MTLGGHRKFVFGNNNYCDLFKIKKIEISHRDIQFNQSENFGINFRSNYRFIYRFPFLKFRYWAATASIYKR